MATVFTHALVGAAIAQAAPPLASRGRMAAVAAVLAVLPDIDVVAFALGIPYQDPLGHRGFTHSLAFALLAGIAAVALAFRTPTLRSRDGWRLVAVLALATASHGVLDSFTDAGLGVGFLLPFDGGRSFAPWRPLATSPIGVEAFFSRRALAILANEARWIGLPVLVCLAAASWSRRLRARRSPQGA